MTFDGTFHGLDVGITGLVILGLEGRSIGRTYGKLGGRRDTLPGDIKVTKRCTNRLGGVGGYA